MAKSPAKKTRFKTSNLKSKLNKLNFSKKHFKQIVSSRRFQFAVIGFFIIIGLSILLIIANNQMAKAEASWPQTLNSWRKRKRLKLTNNSAATLHTDSTFAVNINTKELYDGGYLQNDCDDIRIYYQPNNSTAIDLNYYFDPAAGATNCSDSESTKFYFPLQADMSSGASSSYYYVYLNNSSATAKASVDAFDIGSKQALMVCPFNGDTDCINGDGAESPTTETGAIRYSGSKGALRFDSNDSVYAPSDIGYSGGAYTVEWWENRSLWNDSVYASKPIVNIEYQYLQHGISINFDWTGNINLAHAQSGSELTTYWTTSKLINQWVHYAVEYNGTDTAELFINGTSQGQKPIAPPDSFDGTNNFFMPLGNQSTGKAIGNDIIDEYRVSNVMRYPSDFTPQTTPFVRDDNTLLLYHFDENGDDPRNSGKAIDDSGNGNHGTITGAKYVSGLIGVDASTSDAGNVPSQAYADHSGVFIEEGTTNLVTNPSFENGTAYDTNWQAGGNSFSTFTPGLAKRNSAGPFAAGPLIQGNSVTNQSTDLLTAPNGTKIAGGYPTSFYQNFDMNQGSIVLWWTPEFGSSQKDNIISTLFYTGSSRFRIYYDYSDDSFYFHLNGCAAATQVARTITAGETISIVARWDYDDNTYLNGSASLSINDTHSYRNSTGCGFDSSTLNIGTNSSGNNSADGIIEGLTIYRRPLFDGTYGVDVGNGDEIWKINNGSSHTGSNNTATLTDSAKSSFWSTNSLVGGKVYNQTDGSSGTITANTTTNITATLSGGSENDWDTGDLYYITGAGGIDPTMITGSWDITFALPTNSTTGNLSTGTGEAWSHPHSSNLLYTNTTNTGGFMMNGTYTTDGWTDEGTPSSVSALSSTEKIYGGGYKVTSDAVNEGLYYAKTVAAGDDWVIRALGNSDGTCDPQVILYDQTNGAEIGHLDGTTSSTRTTPDTYIFTGEAPSGMTALRIKLINTASSGTCYWHQAELLPNLINSPSMETGSGDPWIPTNWTNNGLEATDSVQNTTNYHSGTSSFTLAPQTSSSWYEGLNSGGISKTINKFYDFGFFKYDASAYTYPSFTRTGYNQKICPQSRACVFNNSDANGFELPRGNSVSTWGRYSAVARSGATDSSSTKLNPQSGASGGIDTDFDDFYGVEMTDVSLTVTPATSTNSTESGRIRVDGKDTYSHTMTSPTTSSGTITFDYTPRHSGADVAKFGESTPAIAYFTDSAASSGIHNGGTNAATLTDTTKSWTTNQWIGYTIRNLTDGSTSTVTANTATTVTGTLSGGTDNDWDASDQYYIETDDFIKLYWSAANTIKLEYSMAGTTGNGTWDATSAISAGTKYDFEIAYTGSGTMTLKVDDVTKITLSSIPAAFGTAPTLAFWGSDSSGAQQGDATFLPEPITTSANSTAPYYKFGSKSAQLVNSLAPEGRGYITQIDPNSTASHTLSAYVYNGTTGAIGGTVDNTVAQLVWEGSAQSGTTYTDMGGGWWRLTYTAATTDATNDYGINVADGKTIYLDGVQLEQKVYATTYTDGSFGTGYSWSGTANASTSNRTETDLRYDYTNNISGDTGTISFWFKPELDQIDSDGRNLFEWRTDSGTVDGIKVLMFDDSTNWLRTSIYTDTGVQRSCNTGTTTYTKNQWYHFVLTYTLNTGTNDGCQAYLNGTTFGGGTSGHDWSFTSTAPIKIGQGRAYDNAGMNISEFSFYNDSLSSTEISDLYYSGLGSHQIQEGFTDSYSGEEPPALVWHFDEGYGTTAYDSTTNHNDGMINNATWSSDESVGLPNGKSLKLDGSSSFVSRDYSSDSELNPGTDDFTLSTWFKSPSTVSSQMNIISRYNSSGYKVYMNSSGNICFGIDDDSSWGPDDVACSTNAYNDSTWHHINAVKASSSIKLYIDGFKDGEDNSLSITGNLSGGNPTFYAGVDSDGSSNFWSGFLDEIKVFNYSRSEEQVKTDYQSSGTLKGVIAAQGKDQNQKFSQGLVGYWRMDEASWNGTTGEVKDASGNGNNGTRVGDATTTNGKFGNAANFAVDTDYINIPDSPSLSPSNVTVALWVYVDSFSGSYPRLVYKQGSYDLHMYTFINGEGRLEWDIRNPSETDTQTLTSDALSLNKWYHLTATYDGSVAKIYINGIEKKSRESIGTISDSPSSLTIGYNSANGLDGSIDEVRIYNRALSPAEVQGLYKWAPGPVAQWDFDEGSGTVVNDNSGNGNDGTLGGDGVGTDLPSWTNGKFGGGLSFDGSDDYVLSNHNVISLPMTMSLWVKQNTLGAQGEHYIYFDENGADGWGGENECHISKSISGAYYALFCRAEDITFIDDRTIATIPDANWHHLEVVMNTDNFQFYLDGILKKQSNYTGSADFSNYNPTVHFGRPINNSRFFNGTLDAVKIYNYARTQEQIVSDMNAGHPAPGSPVGSPLVYYKMDEGYGTSYANSGNAGSTYSMSFSSGATYPIQWSSDAKFEKSLSFGTQSLSKMGTYLSDLEYRDEDGLTLSAWIKPNSSETDGGSIISKPWNGSGYYNYTLGYGSDNKIKLTLRGNNLSQLSSASTVSTNTWHHVLATINGSTREVRFYIDGKFDSLSTHNVTDWSTVSDLNVGLAIGCVYPYATDCNAGTGQAFYGNIDEVKIYKFALSDSQVQTEYNQGKGTTFGNLGTDSSGNPSNASDRAYCPPGDTTANCGPVAEWNFEEASGQYANDTSGNGNQATLGSTTAPDSNDPTWAVGKVGNGLIVDGIDDYVDIPVLPTSTSAFSISTWVKAISGPSANGGWGYIVHRSSSTAIGSSVYWLGVNSSGNYAAAVNGNYSNGDTEFLANLNTWVYLTLNYDGSYQDIYINGERKVHYNVGPITNGTTGNQSGIGGTPFAPTYRPLQGDIDQVKIYDYARTPAQIAWDYNRGKPVARYKLDECSGGTIHSDNKPYNSSLEGTWSGSGGGSQTSVGDCNTSGTAWGNGSNGKFGSSMNFDGTDDRITISSNENINLFDELSFGGWVKTSDSSGNYLTILSKGDFGISGTTSKFSIGLSQQGYANSFYKGLTSNNVASKDLRDGTWHHIFSTISATANSWKLYVDGKQVKDITFTAAASTDTSGDLDIGTFLYSGSPTSYMNGLIDDVQIYNYPLTAEQVKQIYNNSSAFQFGN